MSAIVSVRRLRADVRGRTIYLNATINSTSSGGGTGDVVGPSSSTTGRAAEFADTTGKLLRQANLTGPGGRPVLDGDGTWADNLIPATIARDSEVTSGLDTKVPTTRTIAGIDFADDVTAAELRAALGVGWHKIDYQSAASATPSLSASLGVAGALEYRVHWRGRSTAVAASATAGYRINSSSAGDYTMAGAALTTSGYFGLMAGSQTNSDRWGSGVFEISVGQVAAGAWSTVRGLDVRVNSGGTISASNSPIHGAWRDSVGAGMSTIQMIPSAGNLDVGSYMYVEVLL